ncbi:dynein light chain 1, cytoplasmic [Cynara cardunculus var. scolymus]|uniref:Dynein light chain n=1 Tax=Cynara cardunculus var. scolymus TaxID=59895 RepID=A0A103YAB5_CYNCS|nr:dynein light chain 1, cytoplasmic [Cynara cardunculus var. scolymus]KVI05427.1 Dynein light chain, type 1/2 [Cynara cardunculus var. scolymus]
MSSKQRHTESHQWRNENMEGAEQELERRSRFLSNLIQRKKAADQQNQVNIRVRASDMAIAMQNKAFKSAADHLHSMPPANVKKIDSKRLALALKKEFDGLYGPAWHCIVGTSFGSYVTHSSGGFVYFSIDKVHVLLFKTTVEPMHCPRPRLYRTLKQ